MLRLSSAKPFQVKNVTEENFYESCEFGSFYLCYGDDLVYISHEDDDYILKHIRNGEKVVAIKDDY